jgi:methyltransferase (TIGR00027 family)
LKASKPSVTARHVAIVRAGLDRPEIETGNAQAETRLYEQLGRSWLPRTADGTRRMQFRTRFFDGETLGAIKRGITQIVIIAAGYDGRALRFAHPGVRWFEVDHPTTQADKQRRLSEAGIEAGHIGFVALDLTSDDLIGALHDVGHDSSKPSLFIVEGIIGYLSPAVTIRLLSALRELAPEGSRLAAAFPIFPRDRRLSTTIRLRFRSKVVALAGEPWLARFEPDEPDAILRESGWVVAESLKDPGRPARHEGLNGVLVTAKPSTRKPPPDRRR